MMQRKSDQSSNPKRRKTNGAAEIDDKLGFLINPETVEAFADPMEPKYCHCKSVTPLCRAFFPYFEQENLIWSNDWM
jgi:hypothetical protein